MSSKTKTTATKEEVTPALVPKLRFPEFREAPGWDAKQIGDVVGIVRTGKLDANAMVANGKYRFYTCAENYCKIDNYAFEGEALLIAGNGANLGYIHHYIGKFNAYQRTYVLQEFAINVLFLKYYLDRNLPARISLEKKDGNTPYIVLGTVTEMPILVPRDEDEQQKLSECLSSVDELTAAQARKLDALKTHKKGLMQQLFPREGETQPRLRFPEFQNAGEWGPRSVSQIAKITTGAKDTQNKVEGGKYPFFVRSQTVERIDSYSYDGEAVLTSGDGVGVGKNFHHINAKFDFHQRVYCIYDFNEEVSGLFFYFYFSEHFGERVMRMSAKNSVDSVRMAMIAEMPVMLPPLPEQQRIASCLSSLDALITAETQKLEALKTHKKGLMQQLFPSPEEVEA